MWGGTWSLRYQKGTAMALVCFDLDGTLISGYMDTPDKDYHTWQPLPGRIAQVERIKRVHEIALVTNQAGVAFGHITEQDTVTKLGRVAMLLGYAAVAIHDGRADGPLVTGWGEALHVFVCYSDARSRDARYATPADVARRKPSGQMIREAAAEFPDHARDGVLMVGDRPEDEQAAHDAGAAFRWADAFFGR